MLTACSVGLLAVGAVDWVTGPMVNVGLLYAVFITTAAFALSPLVGVVLAALTGAWTAFLGAAHPGSDLTTLAATSNGVIRFVFFALLAIGAAALRAVLVELDHLAATDPLTGAWNRRALVQLLDQERWRARRRDEPMTIAYLDLQGLKRVNDSGGHAMGDRMIRSFVEGLRRGLRSSDIIARVGGDEFIVVLGGLGPSAAESVMRRVLAAPDLPAANAGLVTFGGGELSIDLEVEDMLRRADEVMYEAKRTGQLLTTATPAT
ncbi:MAG: GGDEF domain-containing protein [Acidimicrobiales bacterium]|nr:GGDEF domain-containing protein [Acidimicrobiales bacterium]